MEVSVELQDSAALPPEKEPQVLIAQGTGWAPEPERTHGEEKTSCP
jgi:hypothetical protein